MARASSSSTSIGSFSLSVKICKFRLLAAAVFAAAILFASPIVVAQTVAFAGVAQDGSVQIGGPPFCYYENTFSNTSISITLNNAHSAVVGGNAGTTLTQMSLFGCPFAPLPVTPIPFAFASGNIAGNNITVLFSNQTFSGVFSGTVSPNAITGTFTISSTGGGGI
jgi:hypothetical protein